MSTRTLLSMVARLAIGAACAISTTACGGELLRTGRAPVYLLVERVETQPQGGAVSGGFLLSDVRTSEGSAFNDNVIVTLRADAKNQDVPTTPVNAVTLTRYRVDYRRTDGQSRPGLDVPYGFDGALSQTVLAGSSTGVTFEIVRHQAKFEPPLANMAGFGGLGFLSVIADMTIYGRDQNGNEVKVNASVDIHFGDFIDK